MAVPSSQTLPVSLSLERLRIRAAERMGTLVVLTASLLSVGAFIFFYRQGLATLIGDALSHLNISRRVVDNITPGIAQLGGIWLPLPHLLMLPLVWMDPFWQTGLAGSLVSMISYVAGTYFTYVTVFDVTEDRLAGLVGSLVYMTCVGMLYMQSTAMTESLMIGTMAMSLHFLVRWAKYRQARYLHLLGLSVFLASLSRYDGWSLIPAAALCVLLIPLLEGGEGAEHIAEGSTLAFLAWAAYGPFLWMVYSWLIFKTPLYFTFGVGSPPWYGKQVTEALGPLAPKGNIVISTLIYGWHIIDCIGWIAPPILLLGLAAYLWRHKLGSKYLPGYVFLAPVIFNIVVSFLGMTATSSIHVPPYGSVNVRLGLEALPAVAFFAGFLAAGKAWRKMALIVAIAAQAFLFLPVHTMPLVAEPLAYMAPYLQEMKDTAQFLRRDYQAGEKILVGSIQNDPMIHTLGLPLKNIIYEGNHPYWDISLEHPATFATWILVTTRGYGDPLWQALRSNTELYTDFDLVYESENYRIFENRRAVTPIVPGQVPAERPPGASSGPESK